MDNESPTTPFFSAVIPAHNEEECIVDTCMALVNCFKKHEIDDYEIVVVNDNSSDNTESLLQSMAEVPENRLRYVNNLPPHGFGFAVRKGLEVFAGDSVCIIMADASDDPEDVVTYYRELKTGVECVFGSRFMKGGAVHDYPMFKLVMNRIFNYFIKVLFLLKHDDITNAFKAYRREVIVGIQPILSCHFNLTVEIPLKAIVRGYTWKRVPISWTNREVGISKLYLREMGSRYVFIVLYIFLEKLLSKGDYIRKAQVEHT